MTQKALLLFSDASVQSGSADPEALVQLINNAEKGVTAQAAQLEDLLYFLDDENVDVVDTVHGCSLATYDVVYFRHWSDAGGHAIAAARFCQLKGIPFIDHDASVGSRDKVSQLMKLHEAGIPLPKTLIGNLKQLQKAYSSFGFSFPFVLKAVRATRGNDNFLVHTTEDLQHIIDTTQQTIFILQQLVPNSGDYRFLVMGDAVVAIIERKAAGTSHLNNISQGAQAQMIPLTDVPPETLDLAVRAAHAVERSIAGVDLVRSLDTNTYYCFEVNRAPQIEHSSYEQEKAALLAEYLVSLKAHA